MQNVRLKTSGICCIFVCLLFCGCSLLAGKVYSHAFNRIEELPDEQFSVYLRWKDIEQIGQIEQNKYKRSEVHFYSGENRLLGFIYGETNNRGLVVVSQGLGNTTENYLSLIMFFVDKGWRVFAYNNTGVGSSQGESVRGLTQSVFDLDAALKFINQSGAFNNLPIMLLGHSWGGYASCAILNFDHKINAVASFAGFNNGSEVIDKLSVFTVGRIYNLFAGNVRDIERQMFGDKMKLTAVDGINKSNIPVMIVQSIDDDVIFADSISIYAHRDKITNPNAQIVFFDGEEATGHEFVFYSIQQREYLKWADESWKSYKAKNKNVSRFQWAKAVNFDVFKANELNAPLMERINAMFLAAAR